MPVFALLQRAPLNPLRMFMKLMVTFIVPRTDHFHVYYEFRAWWCGKNPGRNHQPAGFTFGSGSFFKNSI